jgi:hypothetical protein
MINRMARSRRKAGKLESWKAVFNNRRFLEETCTLLNERKVLVRALHSMVERRKWGTTKLESWV